MKTFLKAAEGDYEAETDLSNLCAQFITHSSSPELWVCADTLLTLASVKPLLLTFVQTYFYPPLVHLSPDHCAPAVSGFTLYL